MRSTLRNAVVLIAVMAGGCKEDDDEPEDYFDSSVLPNFDGGVDASRPDGGGLGGTFDSSIQFDSSVPALDAAVTPGQDAATPSVDAGGDASSDASAMDAGGDGGPGEGGLDGSAGDGGPRDGGGDARVGDAGSDARVGDAGGDARVDAATFTRVLTILNTNCGICHTTQTFGELQFSGDAGSVYERLVGVDALGDECEGQDRIRVIPGDPDNSLLLQKLVDPPCGDRMPRLRDQLAPALIGEIRSWIAAGAREN